MSKLKIFLVDDHAVVREGVAVLIDAQPDMKVVGQAGAGDLVLQGISDCLPDIVVLDISMPGLNGAEVSAALRDSCPDTQLVALTRHNEPGYVRQMLQAGVRGYVLKQASAAELLTAIRAVANGETYLDSSIAKQVLHMFAVGPGASATVREYQLSERETSVVRLTAFGYSNKEIATQLGLSVKTVETYKTRAMEKLNLYSRAELVRYAQEQGWFEQS
jgi:DNA-binding NarL/FixJ family response regulator